MNLHNYYVANNCYAVNNGCLIYNYLAAIIDWAVNNCYLDL